jgi:formylmethanofuran--tetrahydromethanopterin N-formyltransferase
MTNQGEHRIAGTIIEDTFAEAFDMRYTRMIITATDEYWLHTAIAEGCGYGSSVIACDAEAGFEQALSKLQTPDGRAGAAILMFAFSTDALKDAVVKRVGQCIMTCPTTAVYNGLPRAEKTIPLGKHLRFFGDGYQKSKKLGDQRLWRIPVMDGEFIVEETVGVEKGVAGGNFIVQAIDQNSGLDAARKAVDAIKAVAGVITPFPGGVVRSGSKVGSRYKGLKASTSHSFCPTLRGRVESILHEEAHCAYEIVIDGVDKQAVAQAMVEGINAACGNGVIAISAGNYGGKLGKHHFHLLKLLA